MKKLSIHYTLYLFIITSFFYNISDIIILMYIIILLHELGHLIAMKILKYDVNKITFLPFGAIIECDMYKNRSIISELIVYGSGIFVNVLLFIIFYLLNFSDMTIKLNIIVIVFNLIPILPLDGGRILLSVLSSFLRYKMAMKISYFISIIVSVCLIIVSFIFIKSYNIFFVLFYFLVLNIFLYSNLNKQYESFLLGKYLNKNYYLDYKNITLKEIGLENNFYKGKQNYYKSNTKSYYEGQILENKYRSSN